MASEIGQIDVGFGGVLTWWVGGVLCEWTGAAGLLDRRFVRAPWDFLEATMMGPQARAL